MSCNPTGSGYGLTDFTEDEYAMSTSPQVSHEVLLGITKKAGLDRYVDVTKSGWTVYRREQNNTIAAPTKEPQTK